MEKYKTISPRFFALVVDLVILILLVYIHYFFLKPEMPALIIITGLIIFYGSYHFYSIYLHAVYGQTLGKMAFKIKVLDVSEKPVNCRQAFLRECPVIGFSAVSLSVEIYQISTVGVTDNFRNSLFDTIMIAVTLLWTISEITVTLSNEKRRSIHDYIAGTVVVKTNI